MEKICRNCNILKILDEFYNDKTQKDEKTLYCKDCSKKRVKDWRINNLEQFKKTSKERRIKNRERINEKKREFYYKNREKILAAQKQEILENNEEFNRKRKESRLRNLEYRRAYDRAYSKKRRENDIGFRLLTNLRARVRLAVRGKNNTTRELLGCDIEYFIKHLENQFTSEMSWENYGSYWSIDHIKACQTFDLTDESQQKICFNWNNCRPLPIGENSSKGNTIDKILKQEGKRCIYNVSV